MLSVSDAIEQLLIHFKPLSSELIPLSAGLNRVLSNDIMAGVDLPSFANSSMDGFAVRYEDLIGISHYGSVKLSVTEDIPAGHSTSKKLLPGEAHRIMTGAVIPQGADCVVPVEYTDQYPKEPGSILPPYVTIKKIVNIGDYIRQIGDDLHKSDVVLAKGSILTAQSIGMLAMLGVCQVQVIRQPRIAVASSGDELIALGNEIQPGKIFDSNLHMISAMVKKSNAIVENLGIIRDTREDVEGKLHEAFDRKVDLIVTSGGVSVGAYDFIRTVIQENGTLSFWKVNMRPGKPLVFGNYLKIPFIGLPGNPVSAFVGFEIFVKEAITRMAGCGKTHRNEVDVIVDEDILSDGRQSFLRAVVYKRNNKFYAKLTGHQGSGNLFSLVQANALLIIPSEVKSVRSGQGLTAWLQDGMVCQNLDSNK